MVSKKNNLFGKFRPSASLVMPVGDPRDLPIWISTYFKNGWSLIYQATEHAHALFDFIVWFMFLYNYHMVT